MKAKIAFDGFGGNVLIKHGELVVSTNEYNTMDFTVEIDEIKNKDIDSITISPSSLGSYLYISIERAGWIINIEQDIGNPKVLIIRRHKPPKVGEVIKHEYLTKHGFWLSGEGLGSTPSIALRIPLFVSEVEQVKV